METTDLKKPIILFDGVCNLCNSTVQKVIKNDPHKKFRLGSLQSEQGKLLLQKYRLNEEDMSSFVLIRDGKAYTRSTAALHVVKELTGWWPLLYIFIVVPRPLRNWVYDLVAKNRYRWFGKQDSCMIPDQSVKDRFIDPA